MSIKLYLVIKETKGTKAFIYNTGLLVWVTIGV